MSKGFTQIDNTILDMGLSMEALGLYIQIKRHITKKNWEIKREYCKSISGMGETAFRRVWKELQDKELLLSECTRVSGKFQYSFSLKCSLKNNKKEEAPAKKTPVDSNGNVPICGQITVEEVLGTQKHTDTKNDTDAEKIVSATGCTIKKAEEVLEYAVVCKKDNPVGFAISAINGNWNLKNKETNEVNPRSFNNFEGRAYNYDTLEQMLLGYVEYDDNDIHNVLSASNIAI